MRVNVQLIKAANDSHLWADTFDRKLTDIFSVESEVAKAIAEQLRAKLTGQEEQVIAAKPTDNPEAYDAYLRGLAYTLKTATTPANSLGAQKYLKEAGLDPKFALAWALLSYVDRSATARGLFNQRSPCVKRPGRQPKPRSAFNPTLVRPYWPRAIITTPASRITTRRCITLSKHVSSCPIAAGFRNPWPMSSGGKANGTGAKLLQRSRAARSAQR